MNEVRNDTGYPESFSSSTDSNTRSMKQATRRTRYLPVYGDPRAVTWNIELKIT